jgi:hypothetical protein
MVTGTAPLSYQWKMGGTDITNATNASLVLNNVQAANAGNYTVVASNGVGTPATSDAAVLTVNRLAQTISFGSLPDKPVNAVPFTLSATASSGLAVSYTSSTPGVATVSGNTVTITGVGTTTITASQAGDASHLPANDVSQALNVTGMGNGVLVEEGFNGLAGGAPDASKFEWSGQAQLTGSGQLYLLTQTVQDSWLRSKAGAAPGAGETLVLQMRAAAYAEDGWTPGVYGDKQPRGLRVGSDANNCVEFYSASTTSLGLRVRKDGVESLATYALPSRVDAMHDYEISVSTTSIVFKVDGVVAGTFTTNIPTGVLNVYVSTDDGGGVGNVPVSIESLSLTLTGSQVAGIPPSITTPPASVTVNVASNTTFSVTATGTAPLSYQWQVSTDNGSNWGNLANAGAYSGVNLATLTVSPSSSLNSYQYRCVVSNGVSPDATSSAATLTVNDAAPTNLTYSANPATYTKGSAITNNTPSNSGGAVVSYSVSPSLPTGLSLNTGTGVISGTPTAITATASYTVTAANSGGSTTASLSITVNRLAQTISFDSLPDKPVKAAPFTLSATASSSLPVSYTSSNPGVATVSGNTVAIAGIGSTTITASQAGDATYLPAADVSQTLQVIAAAPLDYDYTTGDGTITITGYTGSGGAVVIPDTINGMPVTSIGIRAFQSKSSLTSVTIPSSVTSIGDWAFSYCHNLVSVVIPNGVTSIGNYAFAYGNNRTSVTLGSSVATIGYGAFSYNSGLISITIPDSVTSIGNAAFAFCPDLTAITVGALNTAYSSSAVGVLFDKSQTALLQYPAGKTETHYTIPDGVVSIGESAFSRCAHLTSVTIPGSIVSIGWSAFNACTSLASVTIPDGVTSIAGYGFFGCTSLTNIVIGSGVTSIGTYAFSGCTSLTSVVIPANVTSIGTSAFRQCTSLAGIYFQGNAPGLDSDVFYNDNNATVYYQQGTTGWELTFGGRPTAMLMSPTITTQPQSQTVTAGASATFSVVATGTPAPTYQWKKGGTDIANATNQRYGGAHRERSGDGLDRARVQGPRLSADRDGHGGGRHRAGSLPGVAIPCQRDGLRTHRLGAAAAKPGNAADGQRTQRGGLEFRRPRVALCDRGRNRRLCHASGVGCGLPRWHVCLQGRGEHLQPGHLRQSVSGGAPGHDQRRRVVGRSARGRLDPPRHDHRQLR